MNTSHPEYLKQIQRLDSRPGTTRKARSRGPEKLAGILRLLERLGGPQNNAQVVHVAGTNGKGLTAEMIGRLLLQAGHSVGVYASPHVADIRERVRIGGEMISPQDFARYCRTVLDEAEQIEDPGALTYFDILTAIAFVAFREAEVGWWIIETGVGGRADSTNVTPKRLCVLTQIGRDHLNVLGGDVLKIAYEKLGIATPGVPVVLARQSAELTPWMLQQLHGLGCPVLLADEIEFQGGAADRRRIDVVRRDGLRATMRLPIGPLSRPLRECAATALIAADILMGKPKSQSEWEERAVTVLNVRLPARLFLARGVSLIDEPRSRFESVVLDGGHNADALEALCEALGQWGISGYVLLLGMMKDKLVDDIARPLSELMRNARRVIILDLPFDRAADCQAFESRMNPSAENPIEIGFDHAKPRQALLMAAESATLVAAGSLWALGEIIPWLDIPTPKPVTVDRVMLQSLQTSASRPEIDGR